MTAAITYTNGLTRPSALGAGRAVTYVPQDWFGCLCRRAGSVRDTTRPR